MSTTVSHGPRCEKANLAKQSQERLDGRPGGGGGITQVKKNRHNRRPTHSHQMNKWQIIRIKKQKKTKITPHLQYDYTCSKDNVGWSQIRSLDSISVCVGLKKKIIQCCLQLPYNCPYNNKVTFFNYIFFLAAVFVLWNITMKTISSRKNKSLGFFF